jgi:hypothetical protein
MGRSRTFKYVLVLETFQSRMGRVAHTPMEWKKAFGRPTTENIGKWVAGFEQSCIDGCNKHLGIDPVVSAVIRYNPGDVVADWIRSRDKKEPMFQVIQ